MSKQQKKPIKNFFSVLLIIILLFAIGAGAIYAYNLYAIVQGNTFQTGTLKINLNDGYALLYAHEYTFEPGMTVERDFFIKNEGTIDAYYKLYFANVEGEIADYLEITIKDDTKILYTGTLTSLTRENVAAADKILAVGETHSLTAIFHMPEGTENEAQNKTISFDFFAEATQVANNPNKQFN